MEANTFCPALHRPRMSSSTSFFTITTWLISTTLFVNVSETNSIVVCLARRI